MYLHPSTTAYLTPLPLPIFIIILLPSSTDCLHAVLHHRLSEDGREAFMAGHPSVLERAKPTPRTAVQAANGRI
jgi:hypothetical protein